MTLIALKPLLYGGKSIVEGEEFEAASARDERILIAVRKATLAADKSAKGKKAAPDDTDEDARRPAAKQPQHKSEDSDTKATASKDSKYQTRKLTAKD